MPMNTRKKRKKMDFSGSTFDSFLDEEGIRGQVEATTVERVLARRINGEMRKRQKTKQPSRVADAKGKRL
jgi:hypothetical protein